ncbi:hypothetical protein BJ508DRAFT_307524 [Ascobolus immersus RN42]|uniref:Uncharacterized protein n=1 Tax=Ascobolus immersus RN42 TaxID=1160509 RepID=A0A3N4I2K4_ASCIM|nr:hypothetical protein BJ508DRAFT_307524 [Ascobolus immersus RN42]
MPTFLDLPFEMRIEIFAQLNTSNDAKSFRVVDRINYQIFTPNLYKKHGFLSANELQILATFGRSKLTRDMTVNLFYSMLQRTMIEKEEIPSGSSKVPRETTVRRTLRNANGTENEKHRALELLKRVSTDSTEAWKPFWYGVESFKPCEQLLRELLENPKSCCNTDSYRTLSAFYELVFAYTEQDVDFRVSTLFAWARFVVRSTFNHWYGPERRKFQKSSRRIPTSVRQSDKPFLSIHGGALIPSEDCSDALDSLRDMISFMKAVKSLYTLCSQQRKRKLQI